MARCFVRQFKAAEWPPTFDPEIPETLNRLLSSFEGRGAK